MERGRREEIKRIIRVGIRIIVRVIIIIIIVVRVRVIIIIIIIIVREYKGGNTTKNKEWKEGRKEGKNKFS